MKLSHAILAFSALMLSLTVKAQESVPATEAFQFLGFPRSIVSTGMAGAGSAMTSSCAALSAFENPAVLPVSVGKVDVSAVYSHAISNNFGGGVAVRIGKGFALSAAVIDQIHPVKDFGPEYGTFAPNDLMIALGAGAGFGKHFSVGFSARIVRQQIMADYVLNGAAFNVMLQYRLNGLSIVAGAANLGSGVKSENETKSPQPSSARVAISYEFKLGSSTIDAALDADYYFTRKFGISVGAQYSFRRMIYARAGYRFATPGAAFPSHLALGLGFQWKFLCLDISYITANAQLANSIGAGISFRF